MKLFSLTSYSEKETKRIACSFARIFRVPLSRGAVVVALKGELGSGKTTFVKGFAKGLGITKIIQSPTFLVAKRHTVQDAWHKNFYHIDAYRLCCAKDMHVLGWNEWVNSPKNIIVVEWAERVEKILPAHRFEIHFMHEGKDTRKLIFHVF